MVQFRYNLLANFSAQKTAPMKSITSQIPPKRKLLGDIFTKTEDENESQKSSVSVAYLNEVDGCEVRDSRESLEHRLMLQAQMEIARLNEEISTLKARLSAIEAKLKNLQDEMDLKTCKSCINNVRRRLYFIFTLVSQT